MSQLKSIIERILVTHAEEDEIKADRRDIYAEAKSAGFDKTALGVAIRAIRNREKDDTPEAQERAAIVDLYLAEYDAPHVRAHMHEANEPTPSRGKEPAVTPETEHVTRSASARPLKADGAEGHDSVTQPALDPLNFDAPAGAISGRDVRPVPLPIAKPIDLTIPAFLDRRIPKPEAHQ